MIIYVQILLIFLARVNNILRYFIFFSLILHPIFVPSVSNAKSTRFKTSTFSSVATMSSAKAQICVDVKVIFFFPTVYPEIMLSITINNIRIVPHPILLLLAH